MKRFILLLVFILGIMADFDSILFENIGQMSPKLTAMAVSFPPERPVAEFAIPVVALGQGALLAALLVIGVLFTATMVAASFINSRNQRGGDR